MSIKKQVEEKIEYTLGNSALRKAERIIRSRSGTTTLAIISFIESALPLPILTDPFLAAAILLNKSKVKLLVAITTLASVMGGLFAYAMATFFFELIVRWTPDGVLEQFHALLSANGESSFVLTLVGAFTPIPYTVVAWVVSVIEGGLFAFIIASIIGRGARYIIVGYTTYRFGPLAISYARRYIGVVSIFIFILAVLYIWLKM